MLMCVAHPNLKMKKNPKFEKVQCVFTIQAASLCFHKGISQQLNNLLVPQNMYQSFFLLTRLECCCLMVHITNPIQSMI